MNLFRNCIVSIKIEMYVLIFPFLTIKGIYKLYNFSRIATSLKYIVTNVHHQFWYIWTNYCCFKQLDLLIPFIPVHGVPF